jgi:predicted ribosome quality control (RQC) complex YloA/Tae2 family protein
MHKNYYLFKNQTNWLNKELKNFTIHECFTFQKSELVLRIADKEELFLKISINPSHPYIVLSKSRNIKGSNVELFKELKNQKLIELDIGESDKIINLKTESYLLTSTFFGRTPNIILKDLNNNEISRFKKYKNEPSVSDSSIKLLPASIQADELKELIHANKDLNIIKLLSRHTNGFNYVISRECCFRSQIDFDCTINTLSENQLDKLSENIMRIYSEFDNPIPLIYYDKEIPKYLAISKMEHLEKDYKSKTFRSLNEAWKTFTRQSIETRDFDKNVKQSHSILNNRIDFLTKTINKIEEFEKLEERKLLSELKGNLILTFLNDVPRGAKSIELENIFSEKKEKVKIKLNPAKSVQDNAQKYFEKFKDIDIQKDRISNRKSALKNDLNLLLDVQNKYSNINSHKEALKFRELLIQKNLIQSSNSNKSVNDTPEHKFRKIVLFDRWNVFIGKNNINNDLLTFNFAHKYDLWFHAQSVPGSHTILQLNNKDEIPPKNIIESVASLAAFHSSAKHSGSVSVIYTQIRYVRRIKKANPGTVSVLQHKTIFVEPKNL